jgi:hypothetical protein
MPIYLPSLLKADGAVAQLVEHRTENPGVGGSTPPRTTKNNYMITLRHHHHHFVLLP